MKVTQTRVNLLVLSVFLTSGALWLLGSIFLLDMEGWKDVLSLVFLAECYRRIVGPVATGFSRRWKSRNEKDPG